MFDVVFIYSRKSPHPCHCAYVYHYQLLFISSSQPTLLLIMTFYCIYLPIKLIECYVSKHNLPSLETLIYIYVNVTWKIRQMKNKIWRKRNFSFLKNWRKCNNTSSTAYVIVFYVFNELINLHYHHYPSEEHGGFIIYKIYT